MDNYEVLARRYRSTTFDEVVGQEAIARTLKNAIASGRVAHAYLFCGTRGVGKTTMARIFARALNCEKGPTPEPCGKCDICKAVHRGDDVDTLEIDGASNNSVDDVRAIRDNASYRPARARFKIYYIDEVHMLSKPAFNALLKTLEEPPEHVKFIFSTTDPQRLPATVLSRCQRFDFRAVPTERIAGHLEAVSKKEKVKAEKAALLAIAREGRGSIRDAMTLLDQVIAVGDGKVTLDGVRQTIGAAGGDEVLALIAACGAGETGKALGALHAMLGEGIDLNNILEQLMRQVRDLMVVKTCGQEVELLDVFGPDPKALAAEAGKWNVPALVASLGYLTEARIRTKYVVDGRPVAELALVRMAALAEMEPLPDVLAHLESLESRLAGMGQEPSAVKAPLGRLGAGSDPLSQRGSSPPPPPSEGEKKKPVGPPPRTTAPAVPHADVRPPRPTAPRKTAVAVAPVGTDPVAPAAAADRKRKMDEAAADPLVKATVQLFEGRIERTSD